MHVVERCESGCGGGRGCASVGSLSLEVVRGGLEVVVLLSQCVGPKSEVWVVFVGCVDGEDVGVVFSYVFDDAAEERGDLGSVVRVSGDGFRERGEGEELLFGVGGIVE